MMEVLHQPVNSLPSPFELEWHHLSGKPWDWKLTRVSNPTFEIPPTLIGEGSFPLRLAQLTLSRFHIARRLLAKQNRSEFVSLVIASDEFFLRVPTFELNARW